MGIMDDLYEKEKLRLAVEMALLAYITVLPESYTKGKCGGYLTIQQGQSAFPDTKKLGLVPIGVPDDDYKYKAKKYYLFSREKAKRLSRWDHHLSSYQSRDPEKGKWGGAIRLHRGIVLSFSGLTEHGDEAILLIACIKIGWLNAKEAKKIADISDNDIFTKLLDHLRSSKLI